MSARLRTSLGFIVFSLFSMVPLFNHPCNGSEVSLGHPVYRFIEKCRTRGTIQTMPSTSFPYHRNEVIALLRDIRTEQASLDQVTRDELDYFLFQFCDAPGDWDTRSDSVGYIPAWNRYGLIRELRSAGLFTNHRDFFSQTTGGWSVFVNPLYNFSLDIYEQGLGVESGTVTKSTSGVDLWGDAGCFSFSSRFSDTMIRGDVECLDPEDYPYRIQRAGISYPHLENPSRSFDFDQTEASITYRSSLVGISFGKGRIKWGNGGSGSLGLSGNAPAFTNLQVKFTFGMFELMALQGKLVQQPPVVLSEDSIDAGSVVERLADKWIAAHRLQINASRFLSLGLYEMIIYGGRSLDPDYLNPLLFLRSVEHYAQDRDNAIMGLDITLYPIRNLKLFGELLIDDLTTSRLGTGFFGNKLAFMAGASLEDIGGIANLRLNTEYTRIEPYTYSHKYEINTAQHYGINLGYPQQPNSDTWQVTASCKLMRNIDLELSFQSTRHGTNPGDTVNVGGDARFPFRDGIDSEKVSFLDGDIERLKNVSVMIGCEIMYNLNLGLLGRYNWNSYSTGEASTKDEESRVYGISLGWVLK